MAWFAFLRAERVAVTRDSNPVPTERPATSSAARLILFPLDKRETDEAEASELLDMLVRAA